MRDLSERDRIREAHPGDSGVAAHVERLMGERENAAAYGQDGRVSEIDAQLEGFGYESPERRAEVAKRRKAEAEKRAAEKQAAQEEARKQAPAERVTPGERKSTARPTGKQQKG